MIKQYDLNNEIKFFAKSEIRLKILSELQKEPKSVKELVNKTNITYSSISSNLVKLEERDYITKKKNKYHINTLSEIYYNQLMEFKNSVDLINNFDEFWNKHNINQLSINSMQNINDLKNSELVETTPLDIYRTHNTIKENILQSNTIKAIFPYLHPDYPQLIENIIEKNGNVEIIIPKNMFNGILSEIDKGKRKAAVKNGNLKVHTTTNELNVYLIICDETMSLGLFKSDGSFDQNRLLTSSCEKSQKWANDLFNFIKDEV